MSQYSVKTGPLEEAGEELAVLAAELGRYKERLESLLPKLPEGTGDIRRQLAVAKDSVAEISKQTRNIGVAISYVIDFYTRAERFAMGGHERDFYLHKMNRQTGPIPKIRSSSGSIMFDKTILPGWLQSAVLNFESTERFDNMYSIKSNSGV